MKRTLTTTTTIALPQGCRDRQGSIEACDSSIVGRVGGGGEEDCGKEEG